MSLCCSFSHYYAKVLTVFLRDGVQNIPAIASIYVKLLLNAISSKLGDSVKYSDTILIYFFAGVGNPNLSRPRVSHGNAGRRRTTLPAPLPPKLILQNDEFEDTEDFAPKEYPKSSPSTGDDKKGQNSDSHENSTQYHKTSHALKARVLQDISTCGGSSHYS